MVSSSLAFTVNEAKYGKGEYNIEFSGIEVRDFLSHAYPGGIGGELEISVLEKYGLAVNFARILQGHEDFALSVPFGKERNVYCGHIHDLPTLYGKIIIDRSTVEVLARGFNSFLSLRDGYPIASLWVKGFTATAQRTPLEVYFRGRVIPAP